MTIDASFKGANGEGWASKVASAFGIDEAAAGKAVPALVDELKARIERAMLSRGGVADVAGLVTEPSTLSSSANLADPNIANEGNGILDVLIGNKHISRGIAARVAKQSDVDAPTVERMLPAIATALVGELQRQSGPALQKLASAVPGLVGAGGSPLPMPGQLPSVDSPPADVAPAPRPNGSMPPASGGNIDAGGPLRVPGDNIPGVGRSRGGYQRQPDSGPGPMSGPDSDPDDQPDKPWQRLPDIVRRGNGPSPQGGGSLEDIIRSIFGNLLGSNRGVIGTIIQLFVVRWIAGLIRRVLGGALGRR